MMGTKCLRLLKENKKLTVAVKALRTRVDGLKKQIAIRINERKMVESITRDNRHLSKAASELQEEVVTLLEQLD